MSYIHRENTEKLSAPGAIRTPDRRLRRPLRWGGLVRDSAPVQGSHDSRTAGCASGVFVHRIASLALLTLALTGCPTPPTCAKTRQRLESCERGEATFGVGNWCHAHLLALAAGTGKRVSEMSCAEASR